jgi:spermidine synthase
MFEILDSVLTPLGELLLRRRELRGRPGTIVTEVTVDMELLMSSLNTFSERALTARALELHPGSDLRVLVGGLGLGYTAQEALSSERVAEVTVVERVADVIRWLNTGLLPLSEELSADPRLTLREGDVYELLSEEPAGPLWDLILIDVDHSPTQPLDASSLWFYRPDGLRLARRHLAPGGVLGVWSASPDERFLAALGDVFGEARSIDVPWHNELVDQDITDVVFLAR